MTKSQKTRTLTTNTCLWATAIILPVLCHFGFASTKFPWPVFIPLLLIWPAVLSNQMLSKAIGDPAAEPEMKENI